ncbi:unnamed protein product [Adineta ricciae]|nr:unnamed protein product [Adineta ricciae]
MARNITQSNALLSGQFTNYRLYGTLTSEQNSQPIWYDDCYCASSSACISQYEIISYPDFTKTFYVPEFYYGCYIVEALLQSSLQCFYDETCINTIQIYLDPSNTINVTALDISLSNRFYENTTIEELLDELMVEKWNLSSSYKNYYNECQPFQCSYSQTVQNSAIYIVTTVIGLIGGLITALEMVLPLIVHIYTRYSRRSLRPKNGKIRKPYKLESTQNIRISVYIQVLTLGLEV